MVDPFDLFIFFRVNMYIDGIKMLPKTITSSGHLATDFKELFSSEEAREAKGVVYFFMSEKPIPRVRGESNILYIGKTSQSLHKRYFRYCNKLASRASGKFYEYIVKNYGGISLGYLVSDNPKVMEAEYFKKYHKAYLEYPPKSKVG
ncbi:MAG: hypothetical protein ACI8WB_005023 [Phenylobacterium sp.]|jgi:hypothetical protein